MKKILLIISAVFVMAASASAQSFTTGDMVINAGIGLGGGYGVPVAASIEKGYFQLGNQPLGLTGYVGYGGHKSGSYKYSDLFIAVGSNYHIITSEKVDFYAGLRLGYDIGSYKLSGESYSNGAFIYTIHAGARYYLSENWGVNAEIGWGLAVLNVGASYKF